jgi:hypothetical protein
VIPAVNLVWTPAIALHYPTLPLGPSGVMSEVASAAQSNLSVATATALTGAGSPYAVANMPVPGPGTWTNPLVEPTTPTPFCSAPTGGGGGMFDCNAFLDLTVPAFVAAGTYQSTMDITVS